MAGLFLQFIFDFNCFCFCRHWFLFCFQIYTEPFRISPQHHRFPKGPGRFTCIKSERDDELACTRAIISVDCLSCVLFSYCLFLLDILAFKPLDWDSGDRRRLCFQILVLWRVHCVRFFSHLDRLWRLPFEYCFVLSVVLRNSRNFTCLWHIMETVGELHLRRN